MTHRTVSVLLASVLAAFASQRPAAAEVLLLDDDDFVEVTFSAGLSFPLFGTEHRAAFVNSNGSLTFGRGDLASIPEEAGFLSGPPRIAGLWADLDPSAAGTVSTAQTASSFSVSFEEIPLFGETAGNSFTITLLADGRFELAYGDVAAQYAISGYSGGGRLTEGEEAGVDLSRAARPVGNGSRPAIHEVFSAGSPVDLSWQTLPFRATWGYFHFYAPDTADGSLLKINGWTGEAQVVGAIEFASVNGLSQAPDGDLFGVDTMDFPLSANLITIDTVTGTGTAVGPLGFPVVNSLAFAGGSLYGVEMDPDVEQTSLLLIDPEIGEATVVAALAAADLSALTSAADGHLLAVDDDTDRLLRIDRSTGAESPIGDLGVDRVLGLERLPDGRLFAIRQEYVFGEGFVSFLLEVDPATGRASEIGSMRPAAAAGLVYRCDVTNGGVELCDRLDNDCDGLADEDFLDLGSPCTGGIGGCALDGTVACSLDGVRSVCDAVASTLLHGDLMFPPRWPPLDELYTSGCSSGAPRLAQVDTLEVTAGDLADDYAGPPGTLRLYQLDCSCDQLIALAKNTASGKVRLEAF